MQILLVKRAISLQFYIYIFNFNTAIYIYVDNITDQSSVDIYSYLFLPSPELQTILNLLERSRVSKTF